MPIHKPWLSREEEALHRDYLRQLQAEGVDVEIPDEWLENSRALDIVTAGPAESTVFESATGGVHYAVLARLVAERSGMVVTDWSPSTDFDEQIAAESFADRDPLWNLGGEAYRQTEVLNSRIEKGLALSCGQIVEGWLLATGLAPIPAVYRNFAVVPFRLSFWDQFGNEIGVDGRLSVLRKGQRDNTGKRPELSVGEAAGRRYLELLAQEKVAKTGKGFSVSSDAG